MAGGILLNGGPFQIATFIPDVVVEAVGQDALGITGAPVETGATVTDHSFKLPCAWKCSRGGLTRPQARSATSGRFTTDCCDYRRRDSRSISTPRAERIGTCSWRASRIRSRRTRTARCSRGLPSANSSSHEPRPVARAAAHLARHSLRPTPRIRRTRRAREPSRSRRSPDARGWRSGIRRRLQPRQHDSRRPWRLQPRWLAGRGPGVRAQHPRGGSDRAVGAAQRDQPAYHHQPSGTQRDGPRAHRRAARRRPRSV